MADPRLRPDRNGRKRTARHLGPRRSHCRAGRIASVAQALVGPSYPDDQPVTLFAAESWAQAESRSLLHSSFPRIRVDVRSSYANIARHGMETGVTKQAAIDAVAESATRPSWRPSQWSRRLPMLFVSV